MKKFCLHDYIDIENDRGQKFERTKNDIMSESVLVSGYYVDDGSETIKDGNLCLCIGISKKAWWKSLSIRSRWEGLITTSAMSLIE